MWTWRTPIEAAVEKAVKNGFASLASITADELGKITDVATLNEKIRTLKNDIADLKTKRVQEEREIQHKLGLHKQRTEHDLTLAKEAQTALETRLKEDAKVSVREAKIAAREEAMKRADELLGEQVSRMERLVDVLVKALPTASMISVRHDE